MTLVEFILAALFACLVVLPLTVYLVAKLGRAGWIRGERSANGEEPNHHNHQKGERRNGDEFKTRA